MTCDLKKLGCFFFLFSSLLPQPFALPVSVSPRDETFCANDVSWYEHNADVGVCHEDAYNSPCPWPPSQEGSKHWEVTPWAVSCQARDPSLSPGGGVAVNWGRGLHRAPLFLLVSVTQWREDTLLASIRRPDTWPSYLPAAPLENYRFCTGWRLWGPWPGVGMGWVEAVM